MKSIRPLAILLMSGLAALTLSTKGASAQIYSQSFTLKGEDGGTYRIRAFIRVAKGTKKIPIKMQSKSNSTSASTSIQASNQTPENEDNSVTPVNESHQ